jgi:hypothetical protein
VLQHPLIRDFMDLIIELESQKASKAKIEDFIKTLEKFKLNL